MEGWEEGKGEEGKEGGRQMRGPGATIEGRPRCMVKNGRGPIQTESKQDSLQDPVSLKPQPQSEIQRWFLCLLPQCITQHSPAQAGRVSGTLDPGKGMAFSTLPTLSIVPFRNPHLKPANHCQVPEEDFQLCRMLGPESNSSSPQLSSDSP